MSAKKTCIITIEIGTNAVRVVAFDLAGNTIASMKGSYPTFHSQPDYSEQDPEQIFITMLYVLKNLLNEHIHPHKIKVVSICFSASMHSVLAIDKSGIPLGNAVIWADNRAKKEAQKLKNSPASKIIYTATGTPMHPMSPLFKIAWFKNNDKERFKQASKFIQLKTYIIQQLLVNI
jgi:gluconokinase